MKSPQTKPNRDPEVLKKKKGLILVYTGDGKGKTTAALGVAFRALGWGMKVAMIQFIKGNWKYGEMNSAKQFGGHFELIQKGEGFTWDTQNPERDKQLVNEAWALCREKMLSGQYQVLIFDEINYVIDYGYLDVKEVIKGLREKPESGHVILTGRNAKKELIDMADLVTEMVETKHPFKDQKIPAQKGIDF
ncbi:MAG: cob(I)yrinic acid a,c-diamide adenosyltransferase [Candidatus Omnitrophica bacterium CG11_big_fil_rev_8_21_14_0_20_45_26]|uniref:corrinoid adenosyltransferase n=1 Tax=Candidatus Abzuiibacterium crystallinum TaxID=1974748 RepID=A0A2H0LME9_9BACT|nr:MAG: cob(I)yrinic acid a,c-diamide adenosyltransferase [Candidatus Omnitrophica bacterium CG11_big_fil_rev_8_21_14_0_20_45_26]PIW65143.1 MAG: cob(I)yrinic acid a,c-diamide adenosyltransferase [Candidatus Omnitrophica bacterium CG12_big_fil_rev_8_21_14_0_65_45_16]